MYHFVLLFFFSLDIRDNFWTGVPLKTSLALDVFKVAWKPGGTVDVTDKRERRESANTFDGFDSQKNRSGEWGRERRNSSGRESSGGNRNCARCFPVNPRRRLWMKFSRNSPDIRVPLRYDFFKFPRCDSTKKKKKK